MANVMAAKGNAGIGVVYGGDHREATATATTVMPNVCGALASHPISSAETECPLLKAAAAALGPNGDGLTQFSITVFTISGCPHCIRAKAVLKQLNLQWDEINVGDQPERRKDMVELTGAHTVPQVCMYWKAQGVRAFVMSHAYVCIATSPYRMPHCWPFSHFLHRYSLTTSTSAMRPALRSWPQVGSCPGWHSSTKTLCPPLCALAPCHRRWIHG